MNIKLADLCLILNQSEKWKLWPQNQIAGAIKSLIVGFFSYPDNAMQCNATKGDGGVLSCSFSAKILLQPINRS